MKEGTQIEVLLHLQGKAPRKLLGDASTTLKELLQRNGESHELLVFAVDDNDALGDEQDENESGAEPLSASATLGTIGQSRVITIHCHRCHKIAVTVNYQSRTVSHRFPPSTRIRRVLRWSKRKLDLTDADADNLALFPCDGGEKLRENLHIGELTTGNSCEICLSLSKDVNIEGAR